jgi:hypothetical protein
MLDQWMLDQLQRDRYLQALREAERDMMFRRAIMAQPHKGVGDRALIWLGRLLTDGGQNLLARYDIRSETCPACTLSCCGD